VIGLEVLVHLGDVERLTFEGERTLHATGQTMLEVAHAAAREEQASHKYQNRTGNTEAGTLALPPMDQGGDVVEVELGVRTEYASHLAKRDFTNFPEIADRCATDIEFRLEDDADRLSSL
jgi:hypothetical protein